MTENQENSASAMGNQACFVELAEAIRLREGAEGISRALWLIFNGNIHSTNEWSRTLHIPVPVLAALRRELEKRDILQTGSGLILTSSGKSLLEHLFHSRAIPSSSCPTCLGSGRVVPAEFYPLLQEYTRICDQRPDVDVTLDQSHATPETGIRKALLLLEKGWLGRSLLFLGDDDLISVACFLVRKHFMPDTAVLGKILVNDIDSRYLDLIQTVSHGEIAIQNHDVRNEWPNGFTQKFDAALTDPPYTVSAISTFAYRCCQVLNQPGQLLLSMALPDSEGLGEIERNILSFGCVVREIFPHFNRYIGASIHAHTSSLLLCEKYTACPPENFPQLRYTPFYTADHGSPGGNYQCTLCEATYPVGPGKEFSTIQNLKKAGCVECGNRSFRRTGKLESHPPVDSRSESEKIPTSLFEIPQTKPERGEFQ